MAIFALLADGVVENTIVADEKFAVQAFFPDKEIIEVTEETGFATVGGDMVSGKFRLPKPFPSWKWNTKSLVWEAPRPFPKSDELHVWDENAGNWVIPDPVEP